MIQGCGHWGVSSSHNTCAVQGMNQLDHHLRTPDTKNFKLKMIVFSHFSSCIDTPVLVNIFRYRLTESVSTYLSWQHFATSPSIRCICSLWPTPRLVHEGRAGCKGASEVQMPDIGSTLRFTEQAQPRVVKTPLLDHGDTRDRTRRPCEGLAQ